MVLIYNIVLIISAILFLPVILIAFVIQPKFRAGFFEKIGFYKYKKVVHLISGDGSSKEAVVPDKKLTTVFHAVSVGEVNAVKDLLKRYKEAHPDEAVVLTTTTKTGQEIAVKSLSDYCDKITYYPYDFFFSVSAFFNTFKPQKVIIAETEIWPCFVSVAKSRGIKVYTVNGRISPHSFGGYKKIKFFLAPLFNKYEKIFMQSESDAKRIIEIGANQDKVEVMGNLKFDITQNLNKEEIEKYKNELKTDGFRIFAGASTHKGEDEIVINAFKKLKNEHQDAKLLLVPRHPQRYDEVSKLIENSGFKWGKRSVNDNFVENDIILLDTMGELSKLFALCHVAFIGGSFTQTGGHNPLEANIWNKPVISGPVIFNFKDVYALVCEKKCAVIVNNEEELTKELLSFYFDNEKYISFGKNAKRVFDESRGAINYVLERI